MSVEKMRRNLRRDQNLRAWRAGFKSWATTRPERWNPEQRRTDPDKHREEWKP